MVQLKVHIQCSPNETLSNKPPTYGRSSSRSSDVSSHLPSTSKLMPTSSYEPLRLPTRRRPILNYTGASNGPKPEQLRLFSPHLLIYFEQTLPLVRFDTPTYVNPRVSFPSHYGPPSVMIHADPAFSRL